MSKWKEIESYMDSKSVNESKFNITRKQAQMILDLKSDELKKMRFLAMLDIDKDELKILAKQDPSIIKAIGKQGGSFRTAMVRKRANEEVKEDAPTADIVLVVGSKNSSNSLRLTEIAESVGTKAYLLDDVSSLNPLWLADVDSVLITAGASAPEHLVLQLIEHLKDNYNGILEGDSSFDEGMTFSMPPSLNSFLTSRSITIEGKKA